MANEQEIIKLLQGIKEDTGRIGIVEEKLKRLEKLEEDFEDIDRNRIKETIDTAYRQNRAEETINWILADNTIRESTVKDLEDVLDAFSLRREGIFTQYAIWRNGDKLIPFVYEN